MSKQKRHHFVPRAYLGRFSEEKMVVVRWRDSRQYTSNVLNVAVEAGFYDLFDDSGIKSLVLEDYLAGVEGQAMTALATIDRTGYPPSTTSPERDALARFLAIQVTRTPEHRERVLFPLRVSEFIDGRELTMGLVAEYLEHHHLGFKPSEKEVEGAYLVVAQATREPQTLTLEFAHRMMLAPVDEMARALTARHWTVETSRKGRFITSDLPVVLWRPPTPRDAFEGIGVATAHEVRFPINVSTQLVMSKKPRTPTSRVSAARAAGCNVDMASGCYRFVVSHPSDRGALEALRLAPRRPVLRFNVGPLRVRTEEGALGGEGEVLHMWTPRVAEA